jgi:hypothetical protein
MAKGKIDRKHETKNKPQKQNNNKKISHIRST